MLHNCQAETPLKRQSFLASVKRSWLSTNLSQEATMRSWPSRKHVPRSNHEKLAFQKCVPRSNHEKLAFQECVPRSNHEKLAFQKYVPRSHNKSSYKPAHEKADIEYKLIRRSYTQRQAILISMLYWY